MTPQQQKIRKARVRQMIAQLRKLYPTPGMALHFSNPWEMAVAVILSAQTTDKQVNKVTKGLFAQYATLKDYAQATIPEVEKAIRAVNFYKNKAKYIVLSARKLRDEYGGKFPNNIDELMTFPGIGRKTATILMAQIHRNSVGITVDTHVRRFAIRFDLSSYKDPKRIEQDLLKIVPKKEWVNFTFRLINYGRDYCPARKHNCKDHPLTKLYPKANTIWPKAR